MLLSLLFYYTDRDPRKPFSLEVAKPFISFFLFSACMHSPALGVLRDPLGVDEELKRFTKLYVQLHVALNVEKKLIELPDIFRAYWRDFGGNHVAVVGVVRRHHTRQFSDTAKQIKPKVVFMTVDWTPYIIV